MGNAFGMMRKRRGVSLDWDDIDHMVFIDERQHEELKETLLSVPTDAKLNKYAKDNVENGTQLISPLISEAATEAYILFIRDYLQGNIEQADIRFRSNAHDINLCANYMLSLRPVYKADQLLYRGINLPEVPEGPMLPFNTQHMVYSYSDDMTVACGFAAMGGGKQVLLTAKPNEARVMFHYSFLLLFPDLFQKDVGVYDPFAEGPVWLPGFKPADLYHLLPQREVLIRNGPKFQQKVHPASKYCDRKTRYTMMGEDTEARYLAAQKLALSKYKPHDPYPNEKYKAILEKARLSSVRELEPPEVKRQRVLDREREDER